MRQTFIAAAFFLFASASVNAQSIVFHSRDLPYDPKTATCDDIIAHMNTNKYTKLMAASLYAHGKHMGKRCFRADYVKAFELYSEIGAMSDMKSILRDIEAKASTGSPLAKSALRKLEKAGYIEKVRGGN